MRTQWRVGFAGATGLDYGVLFSLMDMYATPAADRPQLLADIQVLEAAALKAMAVKYD